MPVQTRAGVLLSFVVVAGAFALPAQAQYMGPSSAAAEANVASILDQPVDDQDVKLQGHLLRKIKHEKYVFSDGSGEIVAEIDDKDFPKQPIDEKTKVEISGEVDTGWNRPAEIEVRTLQIVE